MSPKMGISSLSSSSTTLKDVRHSENGFGSRSEYSQVTNSESISRTSFDTTEKISVFNETFSGFTNNAILIAVVFLFLFLGGLAIPFIFLLRRKAKYTIKKFIKL
ncbi:hypothetical protein PCHDS_000504000 [Plasmodium chabaudi adami]|uniref:Uncharacterized protein n=1 Tax=Plasmodium chabaudi adami TaxID=5826 RepID=A0A1C6WDC4_PLACE|nr:hypothetical protein PCHDS_000504000 [Plasmodium chabaudi adami]